MVAAFRNNALPYPVYGVPYIIEFAIVDGSNAGITSATGLDSELIIDGEPKVDATNEATEIGGGWYYLQLTAAEMTCSSLSIEIQSSSIGAVTVRRTIAPRKLVSLRSGTAQGGASTYITLDILAGAVDDIWNGCLCVATIDSNVEARVITDYTGSNQRAGVTPDWNVTPDSDDTFVIYLPEGRQITQSDVYAVTSEDATPTETVDANVTAMATDVVSAASVSAEAVTKIVASVIAKIGAVTGSGVNTLLGYFQALFRTDASTPSDIGGTFTPAKASNETIAKNARTILTQNIGACANPQAAAAAYTRTVDGVAVTVTHANLTSTGERGTATVAEV